MGENNGMIMRFMDEIASTDADVLHNAKLVTWPDGRHTLHVCSRAIYKAEGWEERGPHRRSAPPITDEEAYESAEREGRYLDNGQIPPREAESVQRSIRRAKTNLRTLCRANRFTFFVTFTLDAGKVDRYNDSEVLRKLNNWLRNTAARSGLAYVLVPERHKDGAVHFHGLINDALEAVDSGTIIPATGGRPVRPRSDRKREALLAAGGHVVYNLPQWRYGFTTAIRLYGNYDRAVGYVSKYIGKAMGGAGTLQDAKIGGRWVYSGGPLQRPSETLLDVDFEKAAELYHGYEYTVKATGDVFHVAEMEGTNGNEKDGTERAAANPA